MNTAPSEKLPRRAKLLYGMGDWGFSMTGTILSVFFAMFLSDVVHLDLRLHLLDRLQRFQPVQPPKPGVVEQNVDLAIFF